MMDQTFLKKIYPWVLLLVVAGLGLLAMYWYFLRFRVDSLITGGVPVVGVASNHSSLQGLEITDENRLVWRQFLGDIGFDQLEAVFQLDDSNRSEEIELIQPIRRVEIEFVDKVVRGIQVPNNENPDVIEHAVRASFDRGSRVLSLEIFVNPQLVPGNEELTPVAGVEIEEEIVKERYFNHVVSFHLISLAAQRVTESREAYDAFFAEQMQLVNSKFNQGELLFGLRL